MPLLVWVKAEGANDAEAFRAEISASSTSAGEGNTTVVASAQPTTSAWWLHSSEPVVGDILDAAVKLFFPARGASGRQYNTQAFELWLQKRRLTNFAQSASDVIEEALKHALDVTPTVANRSGTMDQFMLLRRQGVVFELRLPASPYSNAKRPFPGDGKKKVTPKTGHHRPQEQQRQGQSDNAQTASPPRSLGAAKSPSRSPPSSDSPRTSEISSHDVKAPAALTPVGSSGPAMWIPKSTVEKFYPGKACDKFTPRWGVPKVCDICFEHIASHSNIVHSSSSAGAVVNGIPSKPLSSSPPRRHTLPLPTTPRTPLHIATPRLGAEVSAASEMFFMSPSARLGDAAAAAMDSSYAAARSVYTKTCPQFLPLWGRNDHCSNCYRPVHWHDGYLHDLALKRRRFVMTLRQHHDKEHHRKLMALLPWHHVYHFLSVGDILSCACVSRVCSLTARVLLKSIMALVVKYEAPGDMRMRILRDADRIATALNASRTLSFASIYSTKVLTAVVSVCRCDPAGGGDGSAGEADIAVQIALLQAFHENGSSSVVPPPPAAVQRGSSGKRRHQQGSTTTNPPARLQKSQGSNVSNNSEDNSSPLTRGDTASPALSSVSGTAHNNNNNDASNSNSRIPSIIAVIHTVLQIEPEDLTSEALEAIRDIPRTASSVGRTQRSTPPVISFREHLVSRYGSHITKAVPVQRRMSPTSSLPMDGDADDAQQSALTPLVNYLLTLAHLNLMKKQASRYLEQSFSTL